MKDPIYVAVEYFPFGDLRTLLDNGKVEKWELKLRVSWYHRNTFFKIQFFSTLYFH
jgi:hypothetical protein